MNSIRQVKWWWGLFVIFLSAAVVAIVLWGQLQTQIDHLQYATRENDQWNLSQIEVDAIVFAEAARAAQLDRERLAEVRVQFHALYNRAVTISNGASFLSVSDVTKFMPSVAPFIASLNALAPLIDGPPPRLQAELPRIVDEAYNLRRLARLLGLEGIRHFENASAARRSAFYNLFVAVSIIAFALILFLIAAVILMFRIRSLSERHLAANELSRLQFAATIDNALDPIIIINGTGKVIEFNEAASSVFAYTRDEALGAKMSHLIVSAKNRIAYESWFARYCSEGSAGIIGKGRLELAAMRSDGAEFPIELYVSSAQGASGPIFIAFLRDISKRVKVVQTVAAARDRALAADLAKSEFILVTSHEMRTPLTGVLGALDLLKGLSLNQLQAHFVDTAIASGDILLRYLNDMLDISRIEIGKINLCSEEVELRSLLEDVLRISLPIASNGGNSIELKIGADLRPFLSDAHRLRQIAINLVGNAMKFCQSGSISIEAILRQSGDDDFNLELSVSDTGIGISEADQERIFEDFITVDSSYQRLGSGSGLGLSICRRIVSAMKGVIGVESTLGRGSRFWVRLPVKLVYSTIMASHEETAAATYVDSDGGQKPIRALETLLVEDNEINRLVMREMLQRAGHRVTDAHDGLEGIRKAGDKAFELILMDISMPGIDGLEATRRIRASNGPSSRAVILGVTAHATPGELVRFKAAGMQGCVAKPLSGRILNRAIKAAASLKEEAAAWGSTGGVPSFPTEPLIDPNVLSELASLTSRETARNTRDRVFAEIQLLVPEIITAASCDDLVLTARLVHRLASSASLIGAVRLHSLLAATAISCKAGRSQDAKSTIRDRLSALVEETLLELEVISRGGS